MLPEREEVRNIDNSIALPDELMEFLRSDSYSLLIKGVAGTGKTTLALSILRALNIRKNFLYLSTRAAPIQFVRYHPWLTELFRSGGQGKSKDSIDPDAIPLAFVDARLDEPTPLFERITNQLMDARSPMIIVDTWDSIEEFTEGKSLQTNMRVLQTWSERARAKLILTGENPENKTFDALVDGVVVLNQQSHESRRVRRITLSKLYGVKIQNPNHYFTLEGAKFKVFRRFEPTDLAFPTKNSATLGRRTLRTAAKKTASSAKSRTPPGQGFVPTGYVDLDRLLGGGFPLESVVNIEISSKVEPTILLLLLSKVLTNLASAGQPIRLLPFDGLDMGTLKAFVNGVLPRTYLKSVRLGWAVDGENEGSAVVGDSKLVEESVTKKVSDSGSERSESSAASAESTFLAVMGVQGREGVVGIEREMDKIRHQFGQRKGVIVLVNRDSDDAATTEQISTTARIKFKVLSWNGTLFLRPDIPFAHYLGMCPERAEQTTSGVGLVPMV